MSVEEGLISMYHCKLVVYTAYSLNFQTNFVLDRCLILVATWG